jgi:exodeoxyribonuclease X
MKHHEAIIFDTETTGREGKGDKPATIVEAAYLVMENSGPASLAVALEYESYFNPAPDVIEWGAMATHHILPHELEGSPPSSEFKLPAGLRYMIGHHIDYDWNVAGKPDIRRICTLALSRWLWPELDSHTQSALYYWLHSDFDSAIGLEGARETLRNAHSALYDVKICRDILGAELRELRVRGYAVDTWEALWRISEQARIPTVITFGKHRGDKIADLPASYKAWLLKQEDLDPYVRIAVQGGKVEV